jgi:dihydrofolate reductase
MKVSVFIATSMDGFIAREDGSVDWLPTDEEAGRDDYGYGEFMDSVDVLVMGRNSFNLVRSFNVWPYGDKPVVVLTTQRVEIPEDLSTTVSVMSGEPAEVVQRLTNQGYRHLYVDGGVTIQRFIREGLVDTFIITRIPVLIGSGLPLFGAIPQDIKLHHLGTKHYDNGLVQSRYEVDNY